MGQICCRRLLIATAALLAAPLSAEAQRIQPTASPPVVGWLMFGSPEPGARYREQVREGLRALGHEEGRTVRFEYRFTGQDGFGRVQARELLELKPAVVFTSCGGPQQALRELSRTVPIVAACAEMQGFLGEVASLGRPGGATTGVFLLAPESAGKRLEILKEIRPDLKRVALLYGASIHWESYFRENERAAAGLGLTLLRLPVERVEDLDAAFALALREKSDALVAFFDLITGPSRSRIGELALRHRLLMASDFPIFADTGALFSYGADWDDLFRRVVPRQIDRILKGTSPSDLPVEQPTKFSLVVNLKTANALGVKIPRSVLLRADRLIE